MEEVALDKIPEVDANGNPQLVAVDQGQYFPFSVDPETGTVDAPGQDVKLLNMLARWTKMMPPKAPFPPPPHIVQTTLSKNVQMAKDSGNASYRTKDWPSAIKHYTMGIAMATTRPLWEASELTSDELTTLLANRSAAFNGAEAYVEALCDADAVVKIRKPWSKGHFRKGQALTGLKRYEEARAAYMLGQQFEPDNEEFAKAIAALPKA
ncbi:hypothetical protein MVES1_000072 [Malassezia vespertilionis]|uniref:Translocation protein sec72 n=1 Tax=Malassezia vespertilionis TaxID=2020962 RepID=A0A2N1JG18_9BASI|nr:uncharacterized protein MVES1_000072 [Malassezia vespertilionis]PKI85493.1 hypothetical protein MVES_000067 [Malassezia vespertilionis]WFD04748.1 hypothetical protein MVES1_000072 [Malassezia vespertilionis]